MSAVRISASGSVLEIDTGTGDPARFHAVWLRDNARDDRARSPDNGQRLLTWSDIPDETPLADAQLENGLVHLTFSPDARKTVFELSWLMSHRYDQVTQPAPGWLDDRITIWDQSLEDHLPDGSYDEVSHNPEALQAWLFSVRRFGFARLSGGPVRQGALTDVVDLFGYLRETNYGRWFEVRTEVNPVNLAYTGLGLQAHTDNPYRDPVPTLQIIYCLENSADGGESIVVDGFAAALRLRDENPAGFAALTGNCTRYEFAGDRDVHLSARKPVIELAADGELTGVSFNNRSAAAPVDIPFEHMEDWYKGVRHLSHIVDDPAMGVTFNLEPGQCFIVDNKRVLHARKGFSGEGSRWLQACYADRDGLYSRLAVLERDTNR